MLKGEIDSLILNFGDPQILRKSKKKKETKKKVRLKCFVLCKIGFIKIKPLKLANEMSCLYLFISPNYGFCQTFTIRDMGQPLHPAGLVTFTCHLPRDKFCKKYLSDPVTDMYFNGSFHHLPVSIRLCAF